LPRIASTGCIALTELATPLGPMIAGATDAGVCLLEFTDRSTIDRQMANLKKLFSDPVGTDSNPHLEQLTTELAGYFAGKLKAFAVPLVYPGTPFQVKVWTELLNVPYGETRSYQQLATSVGDAAAVRAVGRTNGLNRIAIVIPCHRVVNKDGALGGYGGGLEKKRYLLNLEQTS
jgi:AraC family transcriptional regulator of adaptative response/methylated-DNA-[protein]-cysteine methyltransferase